MDLGISLLIWLVVAVAVYFLARYYRIRVFSAFILAILVAAIVLSIIRPMNGVAMTFNQGSALASLYWLVMFLTPILVIIYVVAKAVTDVGPVVARV